MIYLILSILSSTLILVVFKLLEKLKADLFFVIVLNYFAASITGALLNSGNRLAYFEMGDKPWIWLALLIGVLLIVMFYTIGKSTQVAGVSVTSVASKMSVVIPMIFSIIYYSEAVYHLKIIGFIVAVIAVSLAVLKKQNGGFDIKKILLPIVLFFGIGLLDSLVKFAQAEYISDEQSAIFSGTCFSIAGIVGVLISIYKKMPLKQYLAPNVLITGLLLGVFNFGSMYFLILALNSSVFDSSIVFAINNIGVVVASVLVAVSFFSEKPSLINWVGIVLSLVAIVLLQY